MSTVRQFQFVKTIGAGAQGTVWEARSPSGTSVAYKVYRADADSADPATDRARFAKEIRTQSVLSHKNIVPVIEDGFDVNGDPFYVMELADGSLQTLINASKKGIARPTALQIFEKVCDAMAYAHSQNVVHRDLNPRNILMYGAEPRVADFGLGRDISSMTKTYTQSTFPQGTQGYMAPEQQAHSLHHAKQPADVYALGKILYTMLTGSNPVMLDMSKVPGDLQYLVFRSTYENAHDRFRDCNELLLYLRSVLGADSSALAPPMDQARAALSAFVNGDTQQLSTLTQVLLSFPADSALYTKFLPSIPKPVLTRMSRVHPADTKVVVSNFDVYADGNIVFEFCDAIADFFDPCFRELNDPVTRRAILRRLLLLGYENNRYYVGKVFAALCNSVWSAAIYSEIIASLLTEYPKEKVFFGEYLREYSMPPRVEAALNQ